MLDEVMTSQSARRGGRWIPGVTWRPMGGGAALVTLGHHGGDNVGGLNVMEVRHQMLSQVSGAGPKFEAASWANRGGKPLGEPVSGVALDVGGLVVGRGFTIECQHGFESGTGGTNVGGDLRQEEAEIVVAGRKRSEVRDLLFRDD
ncbi:MAG: hypothetical protein J6386_06370 [Candidatus Synoicihabitans palmerolidicus]|nr:hypothetical protein [Candidatus Synoicihabitans palmerolidicus]